jgi:hypothetical protein
MANFKKARDVSVLYNVHTVSGAHSLSYKMSTRFLSQDKPPKGDIEYTPPCIVEVKNRWSCTSSSFSFVVWTRTILSPPTITPIL